MSFECFVDLACNTLSYEPSLLSSLFRSVNQSSTTVSNSIARPKIFDTKEFAQLLPHYHLYRIAASTFLSMWVTKAERSPEKQPQTFNTFSEYLRHQFQLSKNASHVDIMTDINKPKKQYDTPPMSPSPRPFNWTGN